MVELADTSDLGSDALGVQVQVLLSAPFKNRWKQRFFFVCKLSSRIPYFTDFQKKNSYVLLKHKSYFFIANCDVE